MIREGSQGLLHCPKGGFDGKTPSIEAYDRFGRQGQIRACQNILPPAHLNQYKAQFVIHPRTPKQILTEIRHGFFFTIQRECDRLKRVAPGSKQGVQLDLRPV